MTRTTLRTMTRPTLAALGLGSLLATGAVARKTAAAPAAPKTTVRVSGPYIYENLDIYLVHGPDRLSRRKLLPLAKALQEKKVTVRETGSVSQLTIENLSDQEVYVQAGEIVKGGKQDRVLGSDLVLPPKSGPVNIGSFCVEHGRWQARGAEAADRFASSQANAAHKDLKLAYHRGSQGEVWSNVEKVQRQLQSKLGGDVRAAESRSSLQLTLENDRVRRGVDGYVRALLPLADTRSDVIGYAFAINGALNSAEVYASRALFLGQWSKLLRATAVEAVAERQDGKPHTPPSLAAVRALLARADDGQVTEKPAQAGTKTVARETPSRLVVETQETARSNKWIHRTYIQK